MIPEPITPGATETQVCELSHRWMIAYSLALKLYHVASRCPFPLSIISGYRTPEHQLQLMNDPDRPAIHPDISTHCDCPATGADLWPGIAITRVVKAEFGKAVVISGLRWGGGSPVDPATGIPSDWNHVDQGPRT